MHVSFSIFLLSSSLLLISAYDVRRVLPTDDTWEQFLEEAGRSRRDVTEDEKVSSFAYDAP